MKRRLSAIADSPSLLVMSRLGSGALGLLSAPLLARALGPEGRGTTAGALSALGFLPILVSMGVPLVVRQRAIDAWAVGPVIRSVRLFALFSAVPSLLIAWAATVLVSALGGEQTIVPFMIAAGVTPIAVLSSCDSNVLIARGRNGQFALVSVAPAVVYVSAICIGWASDVLSVPYVIFGYILSVVGTFLLTSSVTRVPLRGPRVPVGELSKQGRSFVGSQLSEAASYRLDQVIALPLIGAGSTGLYSVAATVALIPYAIGLAIGTAAFRHLATANSRTQAKLGSEIVVRIGLLAGCASALVLALATPAFVPWLFGPEFRGAVIPTMWSLVGSVAVVLSYVASSALTAFGKGWMMTAGQSVGLAVGILGLLILGPILGATGASIASSLGFWVSGLICIAGLQLPLSNLLPRVSDVRATARMLVHGRF